MSINVLSPYIFAAFSRRLHLGRHLDIMSMWSRDLVRFDVSKSFFQPLFWRNAPWL